MIHSKRDRDFGKRSKCPRIPSEGYINRGSIIREGDDKSRYSLFDATRQSYVQLRRMGVHHMLVHFVHQRRRYREEGRRVFQERPYDVYHVYPLLGPLRRDLRPHLTGLHAVQDIRGEHLEYAGSYF